MPPEETNQIVLDIEQKYPKTVEEFKKIQKEQYETFC